MVVLVLVVQGACDLSAKRLSHI